MSIPVSVYIICQDEEDNIARALTSVRDFDEVILVDSGSSDRTLEIAAGFPNVKASHNDWLGYAGQKQHAKSLCKHEWVLSLDSDQACSDELRETVLAMLDNDRGLDGLNVPIVEQNTFSGKPRRFMRPNKSIRFYRRDKGNYIDVSVHEGVEVDGPVKATRAAILHFGHDTLEDTVFKANKYSSLRAQDKIAKGKKPSLLKLVTVLPLMFIKNYIFKRGFLTGTDGFISSTVQAFYAFLKEAKLHVAHAQQKNGAPKADDSGRKQ